MHLISNFFLLSRINTSSSLFETAGDFLLTPARMLFGGREVIVLNDGSIRAMNSIEPMKEPILFAPLEPGEKPFLFPLRTVVKIIAVVTLPLSLIGVFIKLPCFIDKNYREFYMQKLPEHSSRLVEMFQHVHSTKSYVTEVQNFSGKFLVFSPYSSLAALSLFECACCRSEEFHRVNNPRRNNLEKALVQRLAEIHPDKSRSIYLLSMGSGGLMSDFISLERLVLEGFKNIYIDCVDPSFIDPKDSNKLDKDDLKKIKGIREFFNKCSDISVNIHAYKDIKEIHKEKKGNYSAVLAVDYDGLFTSPSYKAFIALTDLVKARSLLHESGFLALGFGRDDTLSGKMMETITLTPSSLIESLASDLSRQLKGKDELLLAFPDFEFAGVVHLLLYALSLAIEKSGKPYKKISIITLSRIEKQIKKEREAFESLSQTLFPHKEIEICCHKQGQKYDLVFTGSMEEEFISNTYSTLLDEEATAYILYRQGSIYRQNGNRQQEKYLVFSQE